MRLDTEHARMLAEAGRVARLATVGVERSPHLVPVVYVIDGNRLYSGSDEGPTLPQRYVNVESSPEVAVLIDNYEEDWSAVWWVRLFGRARILRDGDEWKTALRLLADKYPQYQGNPSRGPVLVVDVQTCSGWTYSDS
jgi:PPOX class probable F420-dependent enzyme